MSFDYDLFDDLVVKYTTVSLSDELNYNTKFVVGNTRIQMYCGYNSRNKTRWITLRNGFNEIILNQTFVKFGRRVELNFYAEDSDLDYYVTLKPIDETKQFDESYDYRNWSSDFELCFVGFEYSIRRRLENNNRVRLVGN